MDTKRPPIVADERTQLVGWYDMQRAIVHFKCEGVSEADAHRAVLPASPLMTMAGVVSHLRWAEHLWFNVVFLGEPATGPMFDREREDADMMVDGVPLGQLLADYERQCAESNKIIAAHSLDEPGKNTDFDEGAASLRWIRSAAMARSPQKYRWLVLYRGQPRTHRAGHPRTVCTAQFPHSCNQPGNFPCGQREV